MKQVTQILTIAAIIFLNFTATQAQDRHFAWTYESVTLPKGAIDVEPWFTYKTGRKHFYNRMETRLEFEFGLTDRLQTAFYLNTKHKALAVVDTADNIIGLDKESEFSISNEWKLNILNPSTSPIGLGLYAEYTLFAHEIELEGKILLDKKTEKNTLALNIVGEYEIEYEFEVNKNGEGEIETAKEVKIENDLAYMRMFKPHFGLGLELRNHNVFKDGEMEHSALFGGPTLFYSNTKEGGIGFFIIFNVLPQITNLKGGDALDLGEYEKLNARFVLGLSF